jgi:hypothetical protein
LAGTTSDMKFKVSLSKTQAQAVTVLATTQNGPATAPQDYVALNNQPITVPANQSFAWVTVKIKGDNVCPPQTDTSNETFNVKITSPTMGTIADSSATGTIIDSASFVCDIEGS